MDRRGRGRGPRRHASTGRIDHSDREELDTRVRVGEGGGGGGGGKGKGEDDVCDGEFLARGVEEDVGADGHGEHGGGRMMMMMLGGETVERFGGGPVVVEERVFVLGQRGGGLRQARVEQGEMRG